MKMSKATLTEQEKADIAQRVAKGLGAGGKLVVAIHRTSQSNLSYSYSIRLVYPTDQGLSDLWLNHWFAAEYGESLTKRDWLKGQGVGTDRYFLAAYELGGLLVKRGLIEDRYQPTRQVLAIA